jgi:hypothetical protein
MGWQTQKHNWIAGAWFAAIIATAWGMGQLKGLPHASTGSPVWILAVLIAAVVAIVASGVWLCVWWWRRLDEASQEAHKVAWYWGGAVGLGMGGLLIGVWLVPMSEARLAAEMIKFGQVFPILASSTQPIRTALVAGWLITAIPAIIGYMVVWAFWWWKRR